MASDPVQDPPTKREAKVGILPSEDTQIQGLQQPQGTRPPIKHFSSAPAYQSPLRHHTRNTSSPRLVKETSNARSRYSSSDQDGSAQHRINQYLIEDEIGRGSFGAVHIATDQYGKEYAVKEFSKTRLRRRAKSNMLRRPRSKPSSMSGGVVGGFGMRAALSKQRGGEAAGEEDNSFNLIREEIAVMKKLNHTNLVGLIEVLDDPEEDSLYMVLEMCKKGVVMKIDVDSPADPYDDEMCRTWFRDLLLGIEYLHAQGVIHRDIKPDNCLLTEDDTLKIVDFGVSEIFEKTSEMKVSKTAGSPAFMAPELCVVRQDDVSGRAADIWSMGVTLYCLRFGKVPFRANAVLDMYNSIINDPVDVGEHVGEDFKDVMDRLLEKDPKERITMPELREHPWVTRRGTDPLLSEAENCAVTIAQPTEAEMNAAITGNMGQLLAVMKAVNRFKALIEKKRPRIMDSFLGGSSRMVQPPSQIREEDDHESLLHKSKSLDTSDRQSIERILVTEGIHRKIPVTEDQNKNPRITDHKESISEPVFETRDDHEKLDSTEEPPEPGMTRQTTSGKGQAHDPLEDHVYVAVGAGPGADDSSRPPTPTTLSVCESPGAVDHDVFSRAYQEELDRIIEEHKRAGTKASLYLTRRVENEESIRSHPNVIKSNDDDEAGSKPSLKGLVRKMTTNLDLADPKAKT